MLPLLVMGSAAIVWSLQGEGQLGSRVVLAEDHFLFLLDSFLLLLSHPLPFLVHLSLLLNDRQSLLGLKDKSELERRTRREIK